MASLLIITVVQYVQFSLTSFKQASTQRDTKNVNDDFKIRLADVAQATTKKKNCRYMHCFLSCPVTSGFSEQME